MTTKRANPKVDAYLERARKWREEMRKLRKILLDSPLIEELKWGKPCYTFENGNVVIVQPFKDSCALMFFKGALLHDPDGVLEKPGENTRAARRVAFRSVREIDDRASTVRALVREAIEAEKAGVKVDLEAAADPHVPEELREKLEENRRFKAAFEALTPGRRRGYLLHFSAPKQSKTRRSRIEKCLPRIFDGKGLHDPWRE